MMTRSGVGIALTGSVLVVCGVLAGLPDFVLTGLGCAAALALALAWVAVTMPELGVRREIIPARMLEGEGAIVVLHVANRRPQPSPALPVVETCAGVPVSVTLPRLPPYGAGLATYAIPPLWRGRHLVQPLHIERSDPLRLLRRGSQACEQSDLIVYPRVVPLRPLFIAGAIDADGPMTGHTVTPGEAFRSLRPYQTGDDPRTIHWKSSARLGLLTVRVNVVPDQPQYSLVLDTSAPPYRGTAFEEAVRITASLCAMALRAGFPLGVATTAGSAVTAEPPLTSADGVVRAFDLLAAASTGPTDPGLAALDRQLDGSTGGVLVVITGRVTAATLGQLSRVRRRHSLSVLVRVGDERHPETDPPGVRVITPQSVKEFAVLWNAVVRF